MDTMVPEKKWTDDRLDDLGTKVDAGFARTDKKMDAGFARVDGDIRELKGETNQRFDKVDERFEKVDGKIDSAVKELRGEMNARFTQVDGRFAELSSALLALHRLLFRVSIGGAVGLGLLLIGTILS
jgi:uncharacterized protein YdcH (DUF465 family)